MIQDRVTEIVQKCKKGGERAFQALDQRELYLSLVILAVGFGSFGLGRLSGLKAEHTPVTVAEYPVAAAFLEDGVEGRFVGSVNSDKYHLPWCSGAERIKEANKVWFATKEEAAAAGYTPAENCKGL